MTMKDTNQSAAPEAEGVDRRVALKRLGLATGGVAASSWVLGSFASPAGAAMGWSAIKCGPGNTVTIPKSRKVFFDVGGGGGGGGNKGTDRNGANGVLARRSRVASPLVLPPMTLRSQRRQGALRTRAVGTTQV